MIRYLISAACIIFGIVVIASAMVGNYRFGYVLNRMQVGATADTLGAFFVIFGLVIASGFTVISLKLCIMIGFLWFANPVASHFLARTEIISNENILDEVVFIKDGHITMQEEVETIRCKEGKSVDDLFREVFKC